MLPLSVEKRTHIARPVKVPSFIHSLTQSPMFIICSIPATARGSESSQMRLLTFKESVSCRTRSRSSESVVEYAR